MTHIDDDLRHVIHLLATAMDADPRPEPSPVQARRDREYKAHRKTLVTALGGKAFCAFAACERSANDGEWCRGHSPDDIAIERACRGERVPLLPHERAIAVQRLTGTGVDIAATLHMSGTSAAQLKAAS